MAEVTRAEFDQLRAEIQEIRDIADATLHAINGSERGKWIELARESRQTRRRATKPTLWGSGADFTWQQTQALERAGFLNLGEVASAPRTQIEKIDGIGPVAVKNIEAALVKLGLDWGGYPPVPEAVAA